jgi:diguanylate cyclase (GGDEF)-like protein
VVFIDLDEFKQINDQYGHSVGDEVLAILGARLKTVIRAGDSVARLGGDEFAVLLTSVREPAEPAIVAERLLEQITAPIEVAGRHLLLTASIGIALGSNGTELLKQADAAMYRAKANGDADYAFYDDELDQSALNRFKRLRTSSSRSPTSRSSISIRSRSSGSRRCCVGSTRRSAKCRRSTSSRSLRSQG